MSPIVYQNLVTCFDSQVTETTTTLKHRVAAPPLPPPPATLNFCRKQENDDGHVPSQEKSILEFGNWASITSIQTIPKESVFEKEKNFYTHPLSTKSSFSKLSAKSLQLCTENLGSETGTDIIAGGGGATAIVSSFPPSCPSNSAENSSAHKRVELEKSNSCRKIKNFPPPLTTISSGSRSLKVRRHTDGGRLIIESVEAPIRSSCLQAERSEGRLKLCFLTESDTAASDGLTTAEDEIDEPINEFELGKEEFDGEMKMEMGIEKFQTVRRCHGNRGFCNNLKPSLWVATS